MFTTPLTASPATALTVATMRRDDLIAEVRHHRLVHELRRTPAKSRKSTRPVPRPRRRPWPRFVGRPAWAVKEISS